MFFFVLPQLDAQQINYAEYFFDNDPGRGNGTSIALSQGDSIDANVSISTASLPIGIHTIFIRTKSTSGEWSLCSKRTIYITNSAINSQIVEAEYFINTDPGFGNGISVQTTNSDSINHAIDISTTALSPGIHYVFYRVKDAAGNWSLTNQRLIYTTEYQITDNISSAEYFIDTDPGFGNGVAIPTNTADSVSHTINIATTTLSPGIHYLFYRVKDAAGKWSLTNQRLLYITENAVTSNISSAEYFFDNDPGFGNANNINFTEGDSVNISTAIPIATLSTGMHTLNIRVKDNNGVWSLVANNLLYKSINYNGGQITNAEYYFDNDPGFGNANSLAITTGDTINFASQINTDNLTTGIHSFNIRVKNSNDKWSISSTRLIYVSASANESNKITATEYYFDNDPGFGNATAINTTAGNTIDITAALSAASLSIGHHRFNVRSKDSLGRWSLTEQRLIYITPELASQKIVALEYTVDTILAFGQGTIFNFNPTDSLDYIFDFNHGLTDTFYHNLYTRVKDASGKWSMLDSVIFRMENCIIPTAQFSINDICFGDSITLYNNSTEVDTATTYRWTVKNTDKSSTDSSTFTIGFSQTGTYQIELEATNMVCIDTMLKSITVFPRPDTTISSFGNVDFCPGEFSVLSANTGIGYQYQWFKNNILIPNATSSFYQAQDSGLYSAAIKNIYNCSDTTASIGINVYDLPAASIINNGASAICSGDSVTLTANLDPGLSYIWYKNGTIINGETDNNLVVNSGGDYKVEISNLNNCSDISSSLNIIVNPLPNTGITSGGNTTFCQGENVILYGSNGIGYSYQWYKNDSLISGATSSFNSVIETGNYKVYTENSYQCGDTSTEINVIVKPSPISNIIINSQLTVCQGDTVKFSTNNINGNTYQWKSYGTNLSGATNSVYNALQSGNYSLITSNSDGCSTESALLLAIVHPIPGATILPLSSTSFCGGDSVILQANIGSNLDYQWYKDGAIIPYDTNISKNALISGAYTVKVINEHLCYSISGATNVSVFPIPTSSFNLDSNLCASDTINIQYNGSASAGAFYNWNFDGATIISGTGQGPYNVIWNNAGVKTVKLSVNENSCSSVEFTDNTLIKSVSAFITAPLTSVCDGDTVILTANSGQRLEYIWLQAGIEMANDTLSSVSLVNTGLYQVKVSDANIGCSQISTPISVTVNTTNFNLNFSAPTTNFSQPPFDVTFGNTTPNMNEYNFQWELGDGNTSTFYNPLHSYQYNGSYTVAMFAENSSTGCRDTIIKQNYIVCTGGAPNPCNITAAISPAGPATICSGDSVLLSASAGTGYIYQWVYNNMIIPGANNILFYAKQSGNYRVIISDPICSQTSQAFILNHYPSIEPIIQATGNIQPCTIDSLKLSLFVNYNSYSWSTGDMLSEIWVSQTGYYQVAVTDNYGCNMTSDPYIVSNSYLNPPELCIVGVDSANHNRLVWERQANALIDSFYVYKESFIAGQYNKIGAIDFINTSVFTDLNSNPAIKAYKYKIAAVDTCGGLTLLGNYHKTIHLTINAGLNGSWNLIWDGYQGFTFNTYRIYRGPNGNNMSLLTQLPSSANSYTDLNPPSGSVYYQIEVIKNTGCFPDTAYAKANTNYNTSRSNTANNANINPIFLTADFNANTLTGIWPVQVEFDDVSSGEPNSWNWNFGDGNTSIEQNPVHTYNNSGVYTVSLAICNGDVCDTIIKTDYIEVLPNGIVEVGLELSAKIYPNPNDGIFNLEINDKSMHNLELHIYSSIGAEVYIDKFKSQGKTLKQLNLKSLSKGVYFLHLNDDKGIIYKEKIVIQ